MFGSDASSLILLHDLHTGSPQNSSRNKMELSVEEKHELKYGEGASSFSSPFPWVQRYGTDVQFVQTRAINPCAIYNNRVG